MTALRIVVFVVALAGAVDARAYQRPEALAASAGFTQQLGTELPAALPFRDESGRSVRFGDYYGKAPIVLVFAWFGCTTLCPTVVANLAGTLARSALGPDRYRVIVASIDPRDAPLDALRMKRRVMQEARRASDWHFVTGREDAIATLTAAAGFRYVYDAEAHQYAHPVGLLLLTPEGKVSRYFAGFDFTPADLRDGLRDAANHAVASPVDRLLLLCFHYTPAGRYSAAVMQALRITSAILLVVGVVVVAMKRRAVTSR